MKNHSNKTKGISLFLSVLILMTSCVSTTMIQSNPTGAKIYINGEVPRVVSHPSVVASR